MFRDARFGSYCGRGWVLIWLGAESDHRVCRTVRCGCRERAALRLTGFHECVYLPGSGCRCPGGAFGGKRQCGLCFGREARSVPRPRSVDAAGCGATAVGSVEGRSISRGPLKDAAVAKLVERVLGKDEVTGSSPVSSLNCLAVAFDKLDCLAEGHDRVKCPYAARRVSFDVRHRSGSQMVC